MGEKLFLRHMASRRIESSRRSSKIPVPQARSPRRAKDAVCCSAIFWPIAQFLHSSAIFRPLPSALRSVRRWASSSTQPNGQNPDVHPQIELDPSFAAVMGDISASLRESDKHHAYTPHELEVLDHLAIAQEEAPLEDTERKSPAAVFGSQAIGAVILPHELSDSITKLINCASQ